MCLLGFYLVKILLIGHYCNLNHLRVLFLFSIVCVDKATQSWRPCQEWTPRVGRGTPSHLSAVGLLAGSRGILTAAKHQCFNVDFHFILCPLNSFFMFSHLRSNILMWGGLLTPTQTIWAISAWVSTLTESQFVSCQGNAGVILQRENQ